MLRADGDKLLDENIYRARIVSASLTASTRCPDGLDINGLAPSSRKVETMTETNLSSIFSSLESRANALNRASYTANQTLTDAEAKLVALNIGVEQWFPKALERTDADGGIGPHETTEHIEDVLGFARVDGKWCFAVKKIKRVSGFYEGDMTCPYENEYIEVNPVPLLKQSRSLRINAIEVLPEFLEQILVHVSQKLEKLNEATEKLAG